MMAILYGLEINRNGARRLMKYTVAHSELLVMG